MTLHHDPDWKKDDTPCKQCGVAVSGMYMWVRELCPGMPAEEWKTQMADWDAYLQLLTKQWREEQRV
jgi:hypothetical protein